MPRAIALDRVEILRRAPLEALQDPTELERRIIPALGLNDDVPEHFPADLQAFLGSGLLAWQWPTQLAPYLATLSHYPIRRYLEIGVQHGGMFVLSTEYFNRFSPTEQAVAADILRSPGVQDYARQNPRVHGMWMDSSSPDFRAWVRAQAPWDLVLIDGNHHYNAARHDFLSVHGHAKAVAFHDTVAPDWPGIGQLWAEVRNEYADEYEFVDFAAQYPEVVDRVGSSLLGIGLAVRRDFGPSLTEVAAAVDARH